MLQANDKNFRQHYFLSDSIAIAILKSAGAKKIKKVKFFSKIFIFSGKGSIIAGYGLCRCTLI
jgi:hypothetical protein